MPHDVPDVPTTSGMEETTQRFWDRWGYWVPPVNNWQAPVQNLPERLPSPENIPGPFNIQPAQEGPRWMSRVRQPRQLPENVYGQTLVVTENSLTVQDFDNLVSGTQIPQGPSHSQAQLTIGTSESSKTALCEASNRTLDFKLITEEGGEDLINFLLAQSTERIPPSSHKQASKIKLPDLALVREWAYKDIHRFPGKQQEEWRQACQEEISTLKNCSVFELVKLPKGKKAIRCRWVFDIKSDGQKKAHLVAKRFSQIEGVDYNKISSPVVCYESVRLLFALAALENWHMHAVDVKSAYLYGKLDKEIYMQQPQGFLVKGKENLVWRLTHALYRLK